MIIFEILFNKANFNYAKALISNKINKTDLKFFFNRDILRIQFIKKDYLGIKQRYLEKYRHY